MSWCFCRDILWSDEIVEGKVEKGNVVCLILGCVVYSGSHDEVDGRGFSRGVSN